MVGGEGDDQLWGSGHGAIAVWGVDVVPLLGAMQCSLLRFGAGGVDGGRCWVPLQGAIVVCYGWRRHFFFTLIMQKLVFVLSGVYAGIIFVCFYLESIWQPWGEFFSRAKGTWRSFWGLQMSAYEICWVGVSLSWGVSSQLDWGTTRRSSMRMPRQSAFMTNVCNLS